MNNISISCDLCSKSFSRKDLLKRHIDSTHSKTPKQVSKCKFCQSTFTRSDSLKRHLLSCKYASHSDLGNLNNSLVPYKVHKGRKRHSCNRCSKLKIKCSTSKGSSQCNNCLKMKKDCLKNLEITDLSTSIEDQGVLSTTGNDQDLNMINYGFRSPSPIDFFNNFQQFYDYKLFEEFNFTKSDLTDLLNLFPGNDSNYISPTKETSCHVLKCHQITDILPKNIQNWLDVTNVNKFISLYFRNFQLHTPFLHMPTFDPLETPDSLLYCIVLIGALYSEVELDITRSIGQIRKALEYIETKEGFDPIKDSKSSSSQKYPLHVVQAYICIFNALSWSSTLQDRSFARENFIKLVFIGRSSGLTTLEHSKEYSKDSKGWKEWINKEMQIRTIYSIFLLDTSFLIFFNDPPKIVPSELNLPLPAHHNSWDSTSYQQWIQTYEARPKFLNTVRYIVNAEVLDKNFTLIMYDFFIIIHALYVNMWFQKQLLDLFTKEQIDQQKKALNIWKILWNRFLECTPKNEWAKFGFCRNAMEYYWLARIFLISKEKQISLEFEKPGALSLCIEEKTQDKTNQSCNDQELMNVISIMNVVRKHDDIKEVDEIDDILEADSEVELPTSTNKVKKLKNGNIFKFLLWDTTEIEQK